MKSYNVTVRKHLDYICRIKDSFFCTPDLNLPEVKEFRAQNSYNLKQQTVLPGCFGHTDEHFNLSGKQENCKASQIM